MERFHKVDEGAVITLSKGVWRQSDLYRRECNLYAKHGAGFIRLFKGGGTSIPTVSWKALDAGPDASFSEDVFSVTYQVAAK